MHLSIVTWFFTLLIFLANCKVEDSNKANVVESQDETPVTATVISNEDGVVVAEVLSSSTQTQKMSLLAKTAR